MTTDAYGVYALYRPDGCICYVGKGRKNRPFQHFKSPEKHKNKHLGRIIVNAGGRLRVEWLEDGLSEIDALTREICLIAEIGRSPNGPLVNLTDGGDGVSGMKHSAETKARLAEISRGRKQSPETIAKRVEKLTGMKLPPRTPQQIALHAEALRGRKHTPEHIEKISASHRGVKRSDEARANMSAAQKGHAVSDTARANMSAAHTGKKQSLETIEKRAVALRGKKRDPSIGARVAAAQRGVPKNPEAVAKMKAALSSPEVRAKMSGENHWRAKARAALGITQYSLPL